MIHPAGPDARMRPGLRMALRLLACCAATLAATAHAAREEGRDPFALYDGKTGVTCTYYNSGARLPWANLGGDWEDRAGQYRGASAWSSADLRPNQTGTVVLDVTGIGRDITLRFGRGPVKFASREAAAGQPLLRLTRSDGGTLELRATADASVSGTIVRPGTPPRCVQHAAQGSATNLTGEIAMLQFPALPSHKRAELVLTIERVYGATSVSALRTVPPIGALPPVTTGFAREYPGDRGICSDRRALYCEDWDRPNGAPPADWWKRTKGTHVLDSPTKWKRYSNGVPFPDHWTGQFWYPDCGLDGSGCLNVHYTGNVYTGNAAPNFDFVKAGLGEQDHVFYRHYIKYAKTFFDSQPCDGGKRPGFGADNTYGGNGGSAVYGYNGWSVRGHYILNCDHDNPIWPRVVLGDYVYHAEQKDFYGDDYSYHIAGLGLVPLDEWVCVEGEIKVNDPGVKNGMLRHWVNGRLAMEKKDLYFRGPRPPQGYGDWRSPRNAEQRAQWDAAGHPTIVDPVTGQTNYLLGGTLKDSRMGVKMYWGSLFHGGKNPFGKDTDVWVDSTIVSNERVGCIEPSGAARR